MRIITASEGSNVNGVIWSIRLLTKPVLEEKNLSLHKIRSELYLFKFFLQ